MNVEQTSQILLTRDDITSILNERLLKIPNIDQLGYEQLLRIYETFAEPLEKRCSRRSIESLQRSKLGHELVLHPEPVQLLKDGICEQEHDLHEYPPKKYLKLSFNTIPNGSRKRINNITINGAQEATPSKRKPITWP